MTATCTLHIHTGDHPRPAHRVRLAGKPIIMGTISQRVTAWAVTD